MRDPFTRLAESLLDAEIRFVVIGVWGINYYARASGTLFTTQDRDLFLPLDPSNILAAWDVCTECEMTLWCVNEPLDSPRDEVLAKAVVERQAVTTAINPGDRLQVDLSLVMAGFTFDEVLSRRRTFMVDEVRIPVASLTDIVLSKAAVGRDKDRLFLATHEDALRQLRLGDEPKGDEQ